MPYAETPLEEKLKADGASWHTMKATASLV
jgi:hypothetical protein